MVGALFRAILKVTTVVQRRIFDQHCREFFLYTKSTIVLLPPNTLLRIRPSSLQIVNNIVRFCELSHLKDEV